MMRVGMGRGPGIVVTYYETDYGQIWIDPKLADTPAFSHRRLKKRVGTRTCRRSCYFCNKGEELLNRAAEFIWSLGGQLTAIQKAPHGPVLISGHTGFDKF